METLNKDFVIENGVLKKYRGNNNTVVIPGEVKIIGQEAFRKCIHITDVTIPDGVIEICEAAFSDCRRLRYINFPDSLTKIGEYAFSGCRNMLLVNKPNCTPVVGKDAFKKVHPSVNAALKAAARKAYTIPGAWIVIVTNQRRHENADRLFCTDILGYHVITDMNCRLGQRMVFFPAGTLLDKEFAEEIRCLTGGFLHRNRLKIRPEKIRGIVSEGLLLPIEVLRRYTDIEELHNGDGFSNLNAREICSVPIPNRMDIDPINNTLLKYYEGDSCPKTVFIPYGIRKIGRSAFICCKKPERVIIPQTVENIGDYAFYKCTSLRNVVIPGSVDHIGCAAFAECSGLTAVKILDGVKFIDNLAFQDCMHLRDVLVPDSVTEVGFKVFDGCKMLKSVWIKNYKQKEGYLPDYSMLERLGNGNGSDFVNVDGVVFNRDMTELIRYPVFKDDEKYTIPVGVKKIKQSAFFDNEHLTEVIIPDSVTDIEHRAFENCQNLQSITIPPSVTYMGNYVFIGIHTCRCSKQQEINGDIGKTLVKTIIRSLESFGTSEGILIRGKKGSEAERYARKNGCAFEAI